MSRSLQVWPLIVLTAGGLAACESPAEPFSMDVISAETIEARTSPGVVFLAMKVELSESMEALFEGRVVADDAGCLRLDSPDDATVVWPKGTTFERVDGDVAILDGSGERIGLVGGDFRLGGGEVPSLHDAMGFTQGDRDLAEAHCPGRYWIVGGG